jgi:hypothetical protein
MVESNNPNTLRYFIPVFPELHESRKRIFVHTETPTRGNWESMVIDNADKWRKYDKVIIDTGTEAPHFDDLRRMTALLTKMDVRAPLFITSGLDFDLSVNTVFLPSFFRVERPNNIIPVRDRNKLYVSLSRLADKRFSRLVMTFKLYEYGLLNEGIVTCGCGAEYPLKSENTVMFPEDFRRKLPMCYDGLVNITEASQFFMTIGNECLINLVNESSFDMIESRVYPGIKYNDGHYWSRPFFTEKTAKAINSRQMMVFACVKGYVDRLRGLGFDMFDDVIDHSYDKIYSPDDRLDAVAKEIKRLSSLGLDRLKGTSLLEERLEHNVNTMASIHSVNMSRYMLKIKSWALNEE